MIRLRIKVDDVSLVLQNYDQIKVYRANSETGSYVELTDALTRIDIIPEQDVYYYYDEGGTVNHWYKTSYFNSTTLDESTKSDPLQGGDQEKNGYTFGNYSPPSTDWGEVLTPDDLRFTYLWGIDLQASDVNASEVTDAQLKYCVDGAVAAFEKEFNLDIRKRVYKVDPSDSLTQSRVWRQGVDYTDEEDWYDFDKMKWRNYGFLQLRHRPVLSVETAELYDVLGNRLLDLATWMRIQKKPGQLMFYPKGSFSLGAGYVGSSVFAAWEQMFGRNFPHAFKIEYTTGYKSSDFVPNDLREVVGMYSALIALAWVGDGLLAGFSSSSLSLDGLSESFSSTQSATSAYFGARIKDYIDRIKEFRLHNKYKYANIPIGFISAG